MILPVRFSAEAAEELDDAAVWYDRQRPGLGGEFMDAVEETVAILAEWPRSGPLVSGLPADLEVRRAPVARFPYHLGYVTGGSEIRVLAVVHDRRRPAYWAPRVDG